ncbi:hypothetical protein VAR608DRAFT_2342 [Variovorax sp. HW608]|uniref:hypothetical protein n=1 Tax=Variovorax sp. HW608 TaxID=1034889 RepID=UPI00081F825D|nr:hypothetical protein [Variovorax sp. HW608]SCK28221.1 hypothetical protein VAR608DRAFT_2342 [Variovorax sp. HW608]
MESDAIYCFDRASVLFPIYPEGRSGRRVIAEISEDTLRDLFGATGGGDSLVQACRDHFDVIEQVALHHHRREPTQPVVLGTDHFTLPAAVSDVSAT